METEVASKTEELLERMTVAIERMAEDPVIQMETGPPVCPHCERMNPVIRVEESGGVGLMAEFVIKARCQHCNGTFYAIPLQFQTTVRLTEVPEILEARKELGGYGDDGTQKQ